MANGDQLPLEIDVTDEHAFRTGVVQHLQLLADRTYCLADIKKTVDKHDRIVAVGKYAAVPAMGILHLGMKHFLSKLGF